MEEILYVVDCGYAYFGLVVVDNYVTEAAPICKWAVGKRWTEVEAYWKRKKATIHTSVVYGAQRGL